MYALLVLSTTNPYSLHTRNINLQYIDYRHRVNLSKTNQLSFSNCPVSNLASLRISRMVCQRASRIRLSTGISVDDGKFEGGKKLRF